MTRVGRGFAFLGAGNVAEKVLGVVKLIMVSRILGPAEFGLYGLVLVVIMTVEQLTQVGVESALIEKRNVTQVDKSSAWMMLLFRGVVVSLALYLLAPSFAGFFGEPRLEGMVRLMVVAVIASSVQSVEYLLARRELQFRPWLIVRTSGAFVDLVTSVSLALLWRSALGLIMGYVVAACARTLISYLISPWLPRFLVDGRSLRHFLHFGRWAGGLSIVLFLLTQGDDLAVGKWLGVTALGLYQMGYRISNMPTSEVTHVFSNFTMPFYARLKNEGKDVAPAYFSVLSVTAMIALPVAVGIVMYARPFVTVILGAEWLPAVPLIQLLAAWGLVRSLDASAGSLFFAMGRPEIDFRLHFWKLGCLLILLLPAMNYMGLIGVALAVVMCGVIVTPFTAMASIRLLGRSGDELLNALRRPALMGIVVAASAIPVHIAGLQGVAALAYGAVTMVAVGLTLGRQAFRRGKGEAAYLANALWSRA